jgi:putative component of toxin-antitoxin plasmid stabilization module
MCKFALERIVEINGKFPFYKLVINGIAPFDEFEQTVTREKSYQHEMIIIQTRMQEISEGKLLPENKFQVLKSSKGTRKEYEIKTRHLRVYMIQHENVGKIFVCGGKKKDQRKSLRQFRSLITLYFHLKSR